MATRPRVGVTGDGRRWAPSWWCLRLGLRLAGAEAVRISVRHSPASEALDALIISGGNDIGPDLYGETPAPRARLSPERDELELRWIRRALDLGLPLLGICRGAQLINVALGGTLHQDIRSMRRRTRNRASLLPTKHVSLEADSRIAGVCQRLSLRVNSLHHQAVRDTGEGLKIVGRDRDEFCQALECTRGRPIIGVQWHPEYLLYLPAQFALFRWLLRRVESRAMQP